MVSKRYNVDSVRRGQTRAGIEKSGTTYSRIARVVDQYPELSWLRSTRTDDATHGPAAPTCLFSPDRQENRYQDDLYRVSRDAGFHFRGIDARGVHEMSARYEGVAPPFVFHQHWLGEIFAGRKNETAGMASVEGYFASLRSLQSRGTNILWTVHDLFEYVDEDERELNLFCLEQMIEIADLTLTHSRIAASELEKAIGMSIPGRVQVLKHSLFDSMLRHPLYLPVEHRLRELPEGITFLMFEPGRRNGGADDLVRAFLEARSARELAEANVVIVGQLRDDDLRARLARSTAAKRVVMIDRPVSDCELTSLCRVADIAVFPNDLVLSSGSYYQAVTFGLPCIVPDSGFFKVEVEQGISGIKYAGSDRLPEALRSAYEMGRGRLRKLGARALTRCQFATEHHISGQFRDIVACLRWPSGPAASLGQVGQVRGEGVNQDTVKLSFCIPVMNRLEDLKATLAKNLQDNRESKGRVEFVVLCFDQDDSVERWITREFEAELEEEYLRFHRAEPLDFWHFGRAKSAFKPLMRGRIYASLDGDNFTGYRGGEHIIDVFEEHDYRCVLHQFQGEWGDGTCGRLSLSRQDYVDFGYDEHFLPRQWDELDAMLSILVQRPGTTYVCYSGRSIIDKCEPFRRYLEDHAYFPPTAQLPADTDPLFQESGKSVGARDSDYVQNDPVLGYSSAFNHLLSHFKNSDRDELRNQYVSQLVHVQQKLVEVVDPDRLERWLLKRHTEAPGSLSPQDIVAVTCVKNEPGLGAWYDYYKSLGVTRFLIIDDGSDVPVQDLLPYEDVHVWRPIVGQFRHAKVFWMEVLLARYCNGLWCLTIDADEFLSLPHFGGEKESPLRRCVDVADSSGQSFFCGFLLDMLPGAGAPISGGPDRESFAYYQFLPPQVDDSYRGHETVRWSYGDKSSWAQRIDVRYRMNQSLDSLRKFPLIRYQHGLHLNQGFHDLTMDGVSRSPDDLERTDLIPIRHYKLWVLAQAEGGDFEAAKKFDAYHHRTRENLRALTSGFEEKIQSVAAGPDNYPYLGFALVPTPSNQIIEITVGEVAEEVSDETLLQRGRFVFVGGGREVSVNGNEITGSSFSSAVDWVRTHTPFSKVLSWTDGGARLSVKD